MSVFSAIFALHVTSVITHKVYKPVTIIIDNQIHF